MKNTQIEWIGSIPDNWEVKPIGSCFQERNEKVSDYEWEPLSVTKQGIVKQLDTAAKSDAHDARKKVCKNDFVINSRSDRKQSCGLSLYDGSVSLINIVLENKKLNPKFVNYLLKNYGFAEEFYRYGSGIVADLWSTNYQKMKKIMIPIPPDEEQRKIADFLDKKVMEIDNIIEKTKETIEDYKKYKQSTIAKIIIQGLINDEELKESGINYLGKIPKSWNIASIRKIFSFISGYAYKSEKFVSETNYQVLRLGNIKNDNLILDDKQVFIEEEYANESQKVRVLKNDILFTMTGTRKKKDYFYTLVIKEENLLGKELYINQRVGCFRANNKNINMKYYNYLLKFQPIVDYIFLFETGTANQGNLGIETINTTMLTVPPLEIQNEISEYLDKKCSDIDNLISNKRQLIEELEQYKKSLIYEYVTGKKQVI